MFYPKSSERRSGFPEGRETDQMANVGGVHEKALHTQPVKI
jgi:hypothetical protein